MSNSLANLVPESSHYADIVTVHKITEGKLYLMADILSQKVLCFRSSHTISNAQDAQGG